MTTFRSWVISGMGASLFAVVISAFAILMGRVNPVAGQITFEGTHERRIVPEVQNNRDVYVLDVATKVVVNITRDPSQDTSGVWSPDGQKLAFFSTRDGTRRMYLWTFGSGVRRLELDRVRGDFRPVWSPDSTHIVFEVDYGFHIDLFVVDINAPLVNSINPRALAVSTEDERFPAWSPDGSLIAFVSWRTGNADIYVVGADGRNIRNLTRDKDWDISPSWSPDGTQIAFFSTRDGKRNIYLMNPDGGDLHRLTDEQQINAGYAWYAPSWSPDGKSIVYQTSEGGEPVIKVIARDGSTQQVITAPEFTAIQPSWMPDGQHLIFTSNYSRLYQIYQVNRAGTLTTTLTPGYIESVYPTVWVLR